VAKVAPAEGSNRRATSTSATLAQESRSSLLTWLGREMREATAFTANWASGRWVVTSASTSHCRRSLTAGAAGVTSSSLGGFRPAPDRRRPDISGSPCGVSA
jgi:hypothetical protein